MKSTEKSRIQLVIEKLGPFEHK